MHNIGVIERLHFFIKTSPYRLKNKPVAEPELKVGMIQLALTVNVNVYEYLSKSGQILFACAHLITELSAYGNE